MKKSNVILITVLMIISAFLLWLWYYLGFNHVDNPLDLVLSIIWWCLTIIAILGITKLEQNRRRAIRTTYLSTGALFNPQAGIIGYGSQNSNAAVKAAAGNSSKTATIIETLEDMLDDLDYDFSKEDFPEPDEMKFECVIRSKKYKAAKKDEETQEREEPKWEGEVARAYDPDADPVPFKSREELIGILRGYSFCAA